MTDRNDAAADVHNKSTQLFTLCDEWVAGLISSDEFSETYREVVFNEAIAPSFTRSIDSRTQRSLTEQFNHAVRCGLAVFQAIEEIGAQRTNEILPVSYRAYYFGKNLGSDATAEKLRRMLAIG